MDTHVYQDKSNHRDVSKDEKKSQLKLSGGADMTHTILALRFSTLYFVQCESC